MMLHELNSYLAGNPYPGRGIAFGVSADGEQALVLYFIMGRSENSRNRVFTEQESGSLITEAADPAKLSDPSLILYTPVRRHGSTTIVTNGDQTDTIYSCLERGIGFAEALRTRTFEPDAPNYTPRISGLIAVAFEGFSYVLSVLKSAGGDPRSALRFFFEYQQPLPGTGHFLHTYEGTGNPLPSFTGEPRPFSLRAPLTTEADLDAFGSSVWESLNAENKVALFVRTLHLDGSEHSKIYNRYRKI